MPITVDHLDTAIAGLHKSSAQLTHVLAQTIQEAVPTSAGSEMQARASGLGRMQAQAGRGAHVSKISDGVEMHGGGVPFLLGAEFGGQRRPRSRHVVHSPAGRAYVVNKRTTMQFAPFIGHTGYFITPVWRSHLQGIRDKLLQRLAREVS